MARLQLVARSAKVFRDDRGRLLVKQKGQRRRDRFDGEGEIGDDFEGEGEIGDDFEGEIGDDFEGIDGEIGDDFEGEIGDAEDRRARRLARKEGRWGRGDSRREVRRDNVRKRLGKDGESLAHPAIVSGSATTAQAGSTKINIRLQHDFAAKDITFQGSTAGTTVNSIFFGDEHVWSAGSSDGIPMAIFATDSFLRGFLSGRVCKGGRDIIISVTLTGAGTAYATLTGTKE